VKAFPKISIALPWRAYRLLKAECARLTQENAYHVPYAAVISRCLLAQLASLHPHVMAPPAPPEKVESIGATEQRA